MVNMERIKTNWLLIDDLNFWDEFTIKSNDKNTTKKYYQILDKLINQQLNKTIEWLESDEAIKLFKDEIDYRRNLFNNLDEVLSENLLDAGDSVDKFIEILYNEGSRKGFKDVGEKIFFTAQDKKAISLLKEYNFNLIKSVSNHLVFSTRYSILRGILADEGIYDISQRIRDDGLKPLPGSTLSAFQRAIMIARTESSRIKTMASLQAYANVGLERCKILTAEDANVCPICVQNAYEVNTEQEMVYSPQLDERIHSLESVQSRVPAHPNCRCAVVPYLNDDEVLSPVDNPKQINLINDDRIPSIRDSDNNPVPIVGNTPQGRASFEEKYGLEYGDLDDEARAFFEIYTGKGVGPFNAYLRGLTKYDVAEKEWNSLSKQRGLNLNFDRALEIKDKIFKEYGKKLEKDIMVCRRENNRYMGKNGETTYQDSTVLSTSIYEYTKKDVYGDEINYIKIPKGTPVFYLEGITSTREDFEILLPANTMLKHVEDIGKHRKIWELT